MMLTIIFTFLLAVSTVSAADNATDDIVGADVESEDVFGVDNQRISDYDFTVDALVDGDSVDISVKLPKNISNPVLIDVNGVGYYSNPTNGEAKLHLDDLPKGNNDVVATYLGDVYYGPRSNATEFVISSTTLEVQVIAPNVTVEQNSLFVIYTIDEFNGNVSIKVEDKVLYNGSVKLLVVADKLTGGDKTATFVFYGDERYVELTLDNVEFSVKKLNPKLTAKAKTFKKSVKTKKYTVTLKTDKNNAMKKTWVTLKVNKKTYKVKTNSKGQATFKITNLKKKGTFKATVNYAGSGYYNAKTVNTKIIVK